MRHLFIRGSYKPMGVSGASLIEALHVLEPEIYGLINDTERVELDGLQYVIDRLPKGIEECRYIHLISREGYENANFERIVPTKRRRNCYRVDASQMYVEMTRGAATFTTFSLTSRFCTMKRKKSVEMPWTTKSDRRRTG